MKAAFKRIVVKQRENYPWCFVKSRKIPETFHYPSIVLPFKTIIFPFFIFTTNNLESFSSNCNYHRNINLKNTLFKASQFPRHSTNSKERIERITIPSLPTLRYPSPLSPFRARKPGRGVLLKRDNETSARRKMETAIVRNRCDQYPSAAAAYTLALLGMKINSPPAARIIPLSFRPHCPPRFWYPLHTAAASRSFFESPWCDLHCPLLRHRVEERQYQSRYFPHSPSLPFIYIYTNT